MKFSIIIPVYNTERYLAECLDSLLAQSYANWEAICVDDGSTDSSGAILNEYSQKDARIKVLHKKNEGVSMARNMAIAIATGEYIGFLDADDAIAPLWLETVIGIISNSSPDLVRLQITPFLDGKRMRDVPKARKKETILGEREVLVWGWRIFSRQGWSVVNFVKREIATTINFPIGQKMQEDTIYFLQIIGKIHSLVQVGYAGYFYRVRTGSASCSKYDASDCLLSFGKVIDIFKSHVKTGLVSHTELWHYCSDCLIQILANWIRMHGEEEMRLLHQIRSMLLANVSFCDVIKSSVPIKAKLRVLMFYFHEGFLI